MSDATNIAEQINALRHKFPDIGEGATLSTLVCNLHNRIEAWPTGHVTAKEARWLIDGFLAELAAVEAENTALRAALRKEIAGYCDDVWGRVPKGAEMDELVAEAIDDAAASGSPNPPTESENA